MDEDGELHFDESLRVGVSSLNWDWFESLPAAQEVDILHPLSRYDSPDPLWYTFQDESPRPSQAVDDADCDFDDRFSGGVPRREDNIDDFSSSTFLQISSVETAFRTLCQENYAWPESQPHNIYHQLSTSVPSTSLKRQRVNDDHGDESEANTFQKQPCPARLAQDQLDVLEKWLFKNSSCPYPTGGDKARLSHLTGLTIRQITGWFARSRQRKFQSRDSTGRSYLRVARRRNVICRADTATTRPTALLRCLHECDSTLSGLSLDNLAPIQPQGFNGTQDHFSDSWVTSESGVPHSGESIDDAAEVSQSPSSGQARYSLQVHVSSPQGDNGATDGETSSSSQDSWNHNGASPCETRFSSLEGSWLEMWLSTLPATTDHFVPLDSEVIESDHSLHRVAGVSSLSSASLCRSSQTKYTDSDGLGSLNVSPNRSLEQYAILSSTLSLSDPHVGTSQPGRETRNRHSDLMTSTTRDPQSSPSNIMHGFVWKCVCRRAVHASIEAPDRDQVIAQALRNLGVFCSKTKQQGKRAVRYGDSLTIVDCEELFSTIRCAYDPSVITVHEELPSLCPRSEFSTTDKQAMGIFSNPPVPKSAASAGHMPTHDRHLVGESCDESSNASADFRDALTFHAPAPLAARESHHFRAAISGGQDLSVNFDDSASTAVSSVSSLVSACSYSSFGPRKGRKLPCESGSKSSPAEYVFQCTFCGQAFRTRYTWRRHEESIHCPQVAFVCGLTSQITDAVASESLTVSDLFCFAILDKCKCHKPLSEPGDCYHGYKTCWKKDEKERTFFREDGLLQHIKIVHKMRPATVEERRSVGSWSKRLLTPKSDLKCGFCQYQSTTWDERMKHVGDHFEAGVVLSSWNVPFCESAHL